MNDAFQRDMDLALEKLRRHRNGEPQPRMRTSARRPSALAPAKRDAIERIITCDHSHLYGLYIPADDPEGLGAVEKITHWNADARRILEQYAHQREREPLITAVTWPQNFEQQYSICRAETDRQQAHARGLAQFELELLAGLAEDEDGEGNLEEYDGFDAEYDDAQEPSPTYLMTYAENDYRPRLMDREGLIRRLKSIYHFQDTHEDDALWVIKPGVTRPFAAFIEDTRKDATDETGMITFHSKVIAHIPMTLTEMDENVGQIIHVAFANGTKAKATLVSWGHSSVVLVIDGRQEHRHMLAIRELHSREQVDEFTWQVDGAA